jgi:signal transduction histidine kinase
VPSTLRRIASADAGYVVRVTVVAALYIVVGRLCLLLDAVGGFATLVWPAAGIALAALNLFGLELWVAVALGALLVNLWTGASIHVACGIALGNTLGAVVATIALKRLAQFQPSLERTRDVIALVMLGALPGSAVSAAIGTLSLFLGGTIPAALAVDTARAWFLGDALGDLVTAPLLLTWGIAVLHVERKPLLEMIAAGICLGVVGGLLFLGPSAVLNASPFGGPYLIFPLLIWPAFRFGPRGATAATCAVSALSIAGTIVGRGPFIRATLAESLTFLQVYMATVTLTCLALAAAARERAAAIHRDLRRKELLSVVSHDLGNPLHAVRLISGMMLKELPTDDWGREARRRIESVQRSTERMRGLVRDLLDLSAIDAGFVSLKMEPHTTDALIREAQEQAAPLAAEKSEVLDAQPVEQLRVSCDHDRILQVFSNLIGNAVKFTPVGGTITIQCSGADHVACFSVTDTGPGIAAADLPLIFERFYRASETARWGNGLGLSIAKGIVEAHGGTIWARSPAGQGATICFTLPLAHRA